MSSEQSRPDQTDAVCIPKISNDASNFIFWASSTKIISMENLDELATWF